MVIRTDEMINVLTKLSDESGMKVTVQQSVRGGLIAGTVCTVGGMLLGPAGKNIFIWVIEVNFFSKFCSALCYRFNKEIKKKNI